MSDDFINMHKRIAMGQPSAETHLKKGGKVRKYQSGGSSSYSEAMKDPRAQKVSADASLARTLKTNTLKGTDLESMNQSDAAKGMRNYGRLYKQGLGMKPDTDYEHKKGGKVKKYAKGGAVAESKVAKLPAMGDKRNAGVDFKAGKAKVATMKKGGMSKKPSLMIAIAVGKKPSARGR
jgi:hypothetical protein